MEDVNVVRAWKDEQYRSSLPQEVQDKLPAAPEGIDELSDDQLDQAAGGTLPAIAAGAAVVSAAASVASAVDAWQDD